VLQRNELWARNFLGLIVRLSSRSFSSVRRASVDNPGSEAEIKVTVYNCDLCLGFGVEYQPAACSSPGCSGCFKFEILILEKPN